MKIERISYKKRYDAIIPTKKIVLTKIDAHHYLVQAYNFTNEQWMDSSQTSYFDGETVHNGNVHYCIEEVDKKFEMYIQYEHFKLVETEVS